MPILIKVSVSRKLTKDFNSRGFGLDITSELAAGAVDDPQAMADASEHLFQLADDLLNHEMAKAAGDARQAIQEGPPGDRNGTKPRAARPPASSGINSRQAGGNNGPNRGRNRTGGQGGDRPLTDAQVHAIDRMAQKLDTNGEAVAREDYGKSLRELSLKEASRCIDSLKQAIEQQSPNGVER